MTSKPDDILTLIFVMATLLITTSQLVSYPRRKNSSCTSDHHCNWSTLSQWNHLRKKKNIKETPLKSSHQIQSHQQLNLSDEFSLIWQICRTHYLFNCRSPHWCKNIATGFKWLYELDTFVFCVSGTVLCYKSWQTHKLFFDSSGQSWSLKTVRSDRQTEICIFIAYIRQT